VAGDAGGCAVGGDAHGGALPVLLALGLRARTVRRTRAGDFSRSG